MLWAPSQARYALKNNSNLNDEDKSRLRRIIIDYGEIPLYKFTPDNHPDRNQLAFLQSEAMIRCLFGGNQTGKSFSAAWDLGLNAYGRNPYRRISGPAKDILVLGCEYGSLETGIWRCIKELIPMEDLECHGRIDGTYDMPANLIIKPTGCKVMFRSAKGGDARKSLQSAQADYIYINEEVAEGLYLELKARCLNRGGKIIIDCTRIEGEYWYNKLEDRWRSGDKNVDVFKLSGDRAVEAGHMSADSLEEFKSDLSPEMIQVRVYGERLQLAGLIFPEFGNIHVVDHIPFDKSWTLYEAVDPGWASQYAHLYIGVDSLDRIFLFDMLYLHQTFVGDVAKAINEKEELYGPPVIRYCDWTSFGKTKTGERDWAQLMDEEYGIQFDPAEHDDKFYGLQSMKKLFRDRDLAGNPLIYISRSTCYAFIEELLQYRWAKEGSSESYNVHKRKPVKKKDHAIDAYRGFYSSVFGFNRPDNELERAVKVLELGDPCFMDAGLRDEANRVMRAGKKSNTGYYSSRKLANSGGYQWN